MRTEAHKFEGCRQVAIDEDEIRADVAVGEVFPFTRERVIDIAAAAADRRQQIDHVRQQRIERPGVPA
jgi:hypothetical protein